METGFAPQSGIDAAQIDTELLPEKAFPAGRGFRVCFAAAAHEAVWAHARGTLAAGEAIKEIGGVLIGEVFRDEGGPFLEIKASIVAEHTRNEGTEVAFTPETWAQINRIKDSEHPDDRIVGWYHTHPNFGIFLSERDKFLHRTAFPQSWAVAYVVDPVQSLEGVFVWSAGEPKETAEYWVGGDKKIRGAHQSVGASAPSDFASGREVEPVATVSRWSFFLTVALGLASLIAVSGFFYHKQLMWADEQQFIVQALASQRQELDRSMQALTLVRGHLELLRQQSKSTDAKPDAQIRQLDSGLQRVREIVRSLEQAVQERQSGGDDKPERKR